MVWNGGLRVQGPTSYPWNIFAERHTQSLSFFLPLSLHTYIQADRQTDTQIDSRQRQRQRERDRDRDRDRETDRDRQSETETTETDRDGQRQTETDRDEQTDRDAYIRKHIHTCSDRNEVLLSIKIMSYVH